MNKLHIKSLIFALVVPLALGGCAASTSGASSSSSKTKVLKVLASSTPHVELLKLVKPTLAKEGVDLQITTLSSDGGITALEQTESGEFDVNYFAHLPYLQAQQKAKPQLDDLVSAGGIHLEPIGFYSAKYTEKDQLPKDATIAIPNDTSNEYRALKILEQNGFIKLDANVTTNTATVRSVASYIKPIKLVEMDAQIIIRNRDQFDGYVTNTNKVIEAGLDPTKALFKESVKDNPFVNILIVKKSRLNDAAVKKLYASLTTPEVKKFIESKYKGAVVAAF